MHRHRNLFATVLGAVLVLVLAAPPAANASPLRKIVRFRAGFRNGPAEAALKKHHAVVIKRLPLVDGASVWVPGEAAAAALGDEPGIEWIEDDQRVRVTAKPVKTQPAEQVPWGVAKVAAPTVWPTTTGDPVKVGIIDTGVQASHPDLVGNVKGGVSCVAYTSSSNDDNGHGTHVAGTVAAVDNSIGVVGVAPAADLYAIKVLDRRGSGYLSDVIEGMDWARANGMRVVNMSLGTNGYSSSLDLASQRLADAGVVQVAAAGNDGPYANSIDYPGALPTVIAVAAVDGASSVAAWSSRGANVALAAPGVSVRSTYKSGGYTTMSGTSMATPHVAGTVALMLTRPDPNGDGWQPGEVRAKLQATALPLGDPLAYGAGLVRADLAVMP